MTLKSLGEVANYKPIARCGMEELAARQITIEPSGGVLFARNPDGEEKASARQQVIDLFHPDKWDGKLNMLTMPGVHWRFERKLLGLREPGWLKKARPKRTHFTGVENDRSIYFAASTQMPGIETPHRLVKPVRREKFSFAELAIKTRHASFFFANIDDFLEHQWAAAPHRDGDQVGWDAAWLDFTGPLSIDRLALISGFYDRHIRKILIVTALKARWNEATVRSIKKRDDYAQWLNWFLPGELLHYVEYFDTSPMAQFAVRKAVAP